MGLLIGKRLRHWLDTLGVKGSNPLTPNSQTRISQEIVATASPAVFGRALCLHCCLHTFASTLHRGLCHPRKKRRSDDRGSPSQNVPIMTPTGERISGTTANESRAGRSLFFVTRKTLAMIGSGRFEGMGMAHAARSPNRLCRPLGLRYDAQMFARRYVRRIDTRTTNMQDRADDRTNISRTVDAAAV